MRSPVFNDYKSTWITSVVIVTLLRDNITVFPLEPWTYNCSTLQPDTGENCPLLCHDISAALQMQTSTCWQLQETSVFTERAKSHIKSREYNANYRELFSSCILRDAWNQKQFLQIPSKKIKRKLLANNHNNHVNKHTSHFRWQPIYTM